MRSFIFTMAALAAMSGLANAGQVNTQNGCVLNSGKCITLRGPVYFVNSFDAPPAPVALPEPEPVITVKPPEPIAVLD